MRKLIVGLIGVLLIAVPTMAAGDTTSTTPTTTTPTTTVPAPDPCQGHTFVVPTYRKAAKRIFHQKHRVYTRQKKHLEWMRSCAVSPAAKEAMRRITHRQAQARRHRIRLARIRAARLCGSTACNRRLGEYMTIRRYGYQGWRCLYPIIDQESHWDTTISYGGGHGDVYVAYGIPQANPGTKMASAGPSWRYDPTTQIHWLLGYVLRYGGPCGALNHKRATGWY